MDLTIEGKAYINGSFEKCCIGINKGKICKIKKILKISIVNINSASIKELQQLKGVGPKLAKRIFEYRLLNGPFKNIVDLKNVKGIGDKFIEKNKKYIIVE